MALELRERGDGSIVAHGMASPELIHLLVGPCGHSFPKWDLMMGCTMYYV